MRRLSGHAFATPIGCCRVAWQGEALHGVRIAPESAADDADTAPAWVHDLVARIQALLRGEAAGFDDVPLAWERVSAFDRRVLELTRAIVPGATRRYGDLAAYLGDAGLARAVGQALGRNPWPIVVPCHRVLAANGRPGGFSAPGGTATKLRLLEIEGAWPGDQPSLFGREPRSFSARCPAAPPRK